MTSTVVGVAFVFRHGDRESLAQCRGPRLSPSADVNNDDIGWLISPLPFPQVSATTRWVSFPRSQLLPRLLPFAIPPSDSSPLCIPGLELSVARRRLSARHQSTDWASSSLFPLAYDASDTNITPLGELQEFQSGVGLYAKYMNSSSSDAIKDVTMPIPDLKQLDIRAECVVLSPR